MAKSGAQRIKEHRQRKIARGFKEVRVWVPVRLIPKLQAYAKRLCKSEVGKCSVPMFQGGCPAGFCDEPAFGEYIDGERYPRAHHIKQEMQGKRMDGKFDGYVPGLACPKHGGPKCPGIEIEAGVFSGCNGKHGDCPTCGR